MNKLVYLVGVHKWKNETHTEMEDGIWSIAGIFEKEEDAIAVCKEDNFFVGPIELNRNIGEEFPEVVEWPGAFYPTMNKNIYTE